MIVYKDESYKIIGTALNVYNKLGSGFLEAVYQEAFGIELQRQKIPYEREKELRINYDGIVLKNSTKQTLFGMGTQSIMITTILFECSNNN